jgi:thymidylate synthase
MKQYFELLKKIIDRGKIITSRGLETKELISEKIIISNKHNFYSVDKVRELSSIDKYLFGELCWYFSCNPKVDGILKYSKFWDKIKNEDGTVNSNYGYLIFGKKNKSGYTQFNWALDQLVSDKNTRKSIILYNDKDYFYTNNLDFVCTQLQQFFIRDGKLTSLVFIRSSDVIRGLTFDIPFWSIVQQRLLIHYNLLREDKIKLGELHIFLGSVHIYKEHYKLVNDMLNGEKREYFVQLNNFLPTGMNQERYEEIINKLIKIT